MSIGGFTLLSWHLVLGWAVTAAIAVHAFVRSAHRRFTGSYEAASFEGNAFPATSWVADSPRAGAGHVRVISHTGYRWSFEVARLGG